MAPRTPQLFLAALLAVVLAGCGRGADIAPRVVLVSFDTLNLRFVDPYSPSDVTPHLQGLADDGTLFERAYTAVPLTLPSHASYLTGRDPVGNRVMLNVDQLPDEIPTLTEALSAEGYATGAFVSLGVLSRATALGRGFDVYDDTMPHGRWYRSADEVLAPAVEWVRSLGEQPFFLWVHLSDPHEPYLAPDAPPDTSLTFGGEWVGSYWLNSKEPSVVRLTVPPGSHRLLWHPLRERRPDDLRSTDLMLNVAAPVLRSGLGVEWDFDTGTDQPLAAPMGATVRNPSAGPIELAIRFTGLLHSIPTSEVLEHYRSEVSHADRAFGRLREFVSGLPDGERTLWAAVSDHGEGLRFHGQALGHASHVYEDQMRTLWILDGPGVPVGHRVVDSVATTQDLTPTILDLLGLDGLEGATGRSLVSCWSSPCGEAGPRWAFGVEHESEDVTALAGYFGSHKVIVGGRQPRYFDLASGPWESVRLAEEGVPADLLDLTRRSQRERKRLSEALSNRNRMNGADEEMLRSLGYLGN